MTINEAINHAEEVAQEKRYEYQECVAVNDIESAEECGRCGQEHEQLAEWLKDYKRLKEQEPKTGHWIEEFNDLEGEVRFTCSSCGKYQPFGTDYCYNCGAKMVEPQESEE